MKPRIVLAGGSGFVGQSLIPALLERDYDIVVLTREQSRLNGGVRQENWDGRTSGAWRTTLEGAAALVNLTGRNINCRHAPENRRTILESRVDSVRVLGDAIARCVRPPEVFVQATGIGIYGDQRDRWCDESTAHGNDFLAEVCQQWEAAFDAINAAATRKVVLRLGVVLGREGGFLWLLSRLTRAFLGGRISDGSQFISWIHRADLVQIFLAAIEGDHLSGVFNATAPNPVTNAEMMRELRRALHRPWSPPVPKIAARFGSWVIGTEAELALISQRCTPKHFLESGFTFDYPELRPALADIYSKS